MQISGPRGLGMPKVCGEGFPVCQTSANSSRSSRIPASFAVIRTPSPIDRNAVMAFDKREAFLKIVWDFYTQTGRIG